MNIIAKVKVQMDALTGDKTFKYFEPEETDQSFNYLKIKFKTIKKIQKASSGEAPLSFELKELY